jgi:hypothetical protein
MTRSDRDPAPALTVCVPAGLRQCAKGEWAVRLVIGDRWRAAVRPGLDARFRDVVRPVSFPDAPRGRVPAYAFAALVVATAVRAVWGPSGVG